MTGKRRRHSAESKAKLALEAVKGLKAGNELAAEYGVHRTRIGQWKGQLAQGAKGLFGERPSKGRRITRRCRPPCTSRSGVCGWSWIGLKKSTGLG
jgi:transposase-like protein